MRQWILPVLFSILCCLRAEAQTLSRTIVAGLTWSVGKEISSISGTTGHLALPACSGPFLAVNAEVDPGDTAMARDIRVEIRKAGQASWEVMPWDEHVNTGPVPRMTGMVFLEPAIRSLEVRVVYPDAGSDGFPAELILHVFDPGPSGTAHSDEPVPFLRDGECDCPAPAQVTREQWCPDGSCFPHPAPEPVFPTHLIIHHSAGSNSSSDWAAVVRSIWNYHVNVNGWSDIGYNWLIDPDGNIYIGRGDDILGAHFCGKNSNTLGTCVMGDFTVITPTESALAALGDLYAWKACAEGIDPLGSSWHPASGAVIPNVSGHRVSCQTSCPGDAFYPMLPQVRQRIADVIEACEPCDLAAPYGLRTTISGGRVWVAWDSVTFTKPVLYLLERKGPQDPDFQPLATTAGTSWEDVSVEPGNVYRYRVTAVSGGCRSAFSVQVVADIPSEWVTVTPTLVSGDATIDIHDGSAGQVRIELYGADGRMVHAEDAYKNTVDFRYALHMGDLPAGLYVLKCTCRQEEHVWKLMKL